MSLRVRRSSSPANGRWEEVPVVGRGATRLGFSFRLPQAEAMGLDPRRALPDLLGRGFEVVRLAALWSRIEPGRGSFDPSSLDWQLDAAEKARAEVILAVGAVKNFGYPELHAPPHHLLPPLPDGALISERSHPALHDAALAFLAKILERYRGHPAITAWQVEHEAIDPLGLEHSWRLAGSFVSSEVELVRQLDPSRPVVLNGFVPMSWPVATQQRWRTRDQGDSLSLAASLADLVGLDVYPSHALARLGAFSAYLDAAEPTARRRLAAAIKSAHAAGRGLLVTEGQAEPWEAVTDPPSPAGRVTGSCPPERVIENFDLCLTSTGAAGCHLDAYLFWGAEYWLLRDRGGDQSYLGAIERIIRGA